MGRARKQESLGAAGEDSRVQRNSIGGGVVGRCGDRASGCALARKRELVRRSGRLSIYLSEPGLRSRFRLITLYSLHYD